MSASPSGRPHLSLSTLFLSLYIYTTSTPPAAAIISYTPRFTPAIVEQFPRLKAFSNGVVVTVVEKNARACRLSAPGPRCQSH